MQVRDWLDGHIPGIVWNGDEGSGRCPLHDDRNPSLSVNIDTQVFICHAGCGGGTLRQLAERAGWDWPFSDKKEVGRYQYRNAQGTVAYEVVRLEPKSFLHYDPNTEQWSTKGIQRVPYRLPELIRGIKERRRVFIVEGEKDVETLTEQGLLATCNAGGVGGANQWKDFAQYFPQETRIVLIPDADQPGQKLMREVARRLSARGCEVRWLNLAYPVAADHGKDVSDWFAKGHTRRELVELANDAQGPEIAGDEKTTARSGGPLQDGAVLQNMANVVAVPITWLWPEVIPAGKLTLLVGDPGLGKSLVTLHMAAHVSRSEQWSDGTPCPIGNVLLLSAEDGPADTIKPRLEAAGADDRKIDIVLAIREGGKERVFNLDSDIAALEKVITSDTRLLIIDPLSAYMGAIDSHVNAAVRGLLAPLSDLAARTGVAVVGVTHLRKSPGPAIYRPTGSLAFVAAARAAWAFGRDPEVENRVLMMPLKQNLAVNRGGFAYSVESIRIRSGFEAPWAVFEPDRVQGDADEILQPERAARIIEREEAAGWLSERLADGPAAVKEVMEEAAEQGFTHGMLWRASKQLGVRRRQAGFHAGWVWELPLGSEPEGELAGGKLNGGDGGDQK